MEWPIGTLVYQARNNAIETRWPIKTAVIKRRPVVSTIGNVQGTTDLRVISMLRTFVSNVDSPAEPGNDAGWRNDWISGGSVWDISGNEELINTWNIPDSGAFVDENGYMRVRHILFAIKQMSDESGGRINEVELFPPSSVVSGSSVNMTVANAFRYILGTMGIEDDNIVTATASSQYIPPFSTGTSKYLSVLSDLALRTGQAVVAGAKDDIVSVFWNPGWPVPSISPNWTTLTPDNLSSAAITQRDNRTISQVVVTVRDEDGNTAIGKYPPQPRSTGEVVTDQTVYTAQLEQADGIARYIFWSSVLDAVSATTVGPAPWASSGIYRVNMDWEPSSTAGITGTHTVEEIEHAISLSDPRTWVSTLKLKKAIHIA